MIVVLHINTRVYTHVAYVIDRAKGHVAANNTPLLFALVLID